MEQTDDPDAYDMEESRLQESYRKTEREVLDLVQPVLEAIRESIYSGRK